MAQQRDTQRLKIMRAENSLGPQRQYVLEEINKNVGFITRSRLWGEIVKDHPERRYVHVVPAEGCGSYYVNSTGWARRNAVIGVAQNRWTDLHVIHALAHYIQPENSKYHGPEFAGAYLKLATRYLPTIAPALRSALRAERVKTYTWSPEAREAASKRMIDKRFKEAAVNARSLIESLESEKDE